jgi:hypothetical protein
MLSYETIYAVVFIIIASSSAVILLAGCCALALDRCRKKRPRNTPPAYHSGVGCDSAALEVASSFFPHQR